SIGVIVELVQIPCRFGWPSSVRRPVWGFPAARGWPGSEPIAITTANAPPKATNRRVIETSISSEGLPARPPDGRSSEGQVRAELHHAAVLDQRGLEPQWTEVGIFHLNGAAVKQVVDVEIARQADPLIQLKAFAQPHVESRIPIFEQRSRDNQRNGGGVRAHH